MATKFGPMKLYPDDKSNPTRAQIHQLILSQIPGYIQEFRKATGIELSPPEVVVEMAGHWIISKYKEAEAEAKLQLGEPESGDTDVAAKQDIQAESTGTVPDSGQAPVPSTESEG